MAQYQLGVCLENGIGVAKNEIEAMEWYEKAAEQGHDEAKMKKNAKKYE
jgi:TPR repeat protein